MLLISASSGVQNNCIECSPLYLENRPSLEDFNEALMQGLRQTPIASISMHSCKESRGLFLYCRVHIQTPCYEREQSSMQTVTRHNNNRYQKVRRGMPSHLVRSVASTSASQGDRPEPTRVACTRFNQSTHGGLSGRAD